MKKLIFIIMFLPFIVGCDSSSSSNDNPPAPTPPDPDPTPPIETITPMVVGEVYQVLPGDELYKTSDQARVEIAHFEDSNVSGVILVSGSANLLTHQ